MVTDCSECDGVYVSGWEYVGSVGVWVCTLSATYGVCVCVCVWCQLGLCMDFGDYSCMSVGSWAMGWVCMSVGCRYICGISYTVILFLHFAEG